MAKKPPTEAPKKKQTDWEAATMAPILTKREQELRDKFVTEYLVDSDYVKAAIRVGYGPSFAAEYAVKFSAEPYVQQQISARRNDTVTLTAEQKKDLVDKHLVRIFTNEGAPFASQVAALGKYQDLHGMNAPVKKELSGPNGTLLMPTTLQVFFDDDPEPD